jgi:tRNA-Thr(GGU) m(6)t(6)A37 methyltransferase TsaA
MTEKQIIYEPIGTIHSPFKEPVGTPIQPRAGVGVAGSIVLDLKYQKGLQDLEGFSHLILIYHLHQAGEGDLLVKPFLDDQIRGVFSTRAPRRPNGIGISVVKLVGIEGNILQIENLDILDSTPLLDIKPYIPDFDYSPNARVGWLEKNRDQIQDKQADDRFSSK